MLMRGAGFLAFCLMTLLIGCSEDSRFAFLPSPENNPTRNDSKTPELTKGSRTALLVYNSSSGESIQVAEYYRKKRNISKENLCPIRVANSLFGTPQDLLSVRRQILENCLCPIVSPSETCTEADIPVILQNIDEVPRHLVFFKGIPTHLKQHPWPDSHQASFDFYLAHSILSEKATCGGSDCLFGAGTTGLEILPKSNAYTRLYRTGDPGSAPGDIPSLDPLIHRAFAYGRIEGLTLEGTLSLIDRTLEAEKQGPRGTVYGSYEVASALPQLLLEATGSSAPVCKTPLTGAQFPISGYPSCHVGWDTEGVPVSSTGNVRSVTNAMAYFGENVMWNIPIHLVQRGFVGDYSRFLSWKKTEVACEAFCRNLPSHERDACKANSVDPLKEINSDCLGVNIGFFGQQVRSFPVQFMAVYPKGWQTVDAGPHTATPPQVVQVGGVQTDRFTDTKYMVFGDETFRSGANCLDTAGQAVECQPRNEVFAYRFFDLAEPVAVGSDLHTFKFKFRYKGYSSTPAPMEVVFYLLGPQGNVFWVTSNLTLSVESADWGEVEETLSLAFPNPILISRVAVFLQSPTTDGSSPSYSFNRIPFRGHFGIDGIEIKSETLERDFISADAGSFNEPFTDNLVAGDWAGQVQRLGGVAWWGSMSHFMTGGLAFGPRESVMEAFLSGKTLGESLLYTGTGMSGIIYADPLYQPWDINLSMDRSLFEEGEPLAGKRLWEREQNSPITEPTPATILVSENSPASVKEAPLYFRAAFGQAVESHYSLDICVGHFDYSNCVDWENLGSGGVASGIVPRTEGGVWGLVQRNGFHIVRLKVYPNDDPQAALYQYARFYFVKDLVPITMMFDRARLIGTTWSYLLQNSLVSAGSFIEGNFHAGRANLNRFEFFCNGTFGLCDGSNLTLEVTSKKGYPISAFTKSVQWNYDNAGEFREFIHFTFNQNLPPCDTLKVTLSNGAHSVVIEDFVVATGDFNRDTYVDNLDLLTMKEGIGLSLPAHRTNLNGDGFTDLLDFILFRQNSGCSASPAP